MEAQGFMLLYKINAVTFDFIFVKKGHPYDFEISRREEKYFKRHKVEISSVTSMRAL